MQRKYEVIHAHKIAPFFFVKLHVSLWIAYNESHP